MSPLSGPCAHLPSRGKERAVGVIRSAMPRKVHSRASVHGEGRCAPPHRLCSLQAPYMYVRRICTKMACPAKPHRCAQKPAVSHLHAQPHADGRTAVGRRGPEAARRHEARRGFAEAAAVDMYRCTYCSVVGDHRTLTVAGSCEPVRRTVLVLAWTVWAPHKAAQSKQPIGRRSWSRSCQRRQHVRPYKVYVRLVVCTCPQLYKGKDMGIGKRTERARSAFRHCLSRYLTPPANVVSRDDTGWARMTQTWTDMRVWSRPRRFVLLWLVTTAHTTMSKDGACCVLVSGRRHLPTTQRIRQHMSLVPLNFLPLRTAALALCGGGLTPSLAGIYSGWPVSRRLKQMTKGRLHAKQPSG